MKIKIIVVGKSAGKDLISLEQKFEDRLKHYCKIDYIIIPQIKKAGKLLPKDLKHKEGLAILSKVSANDHLILLDEKGEMFNSIEFSKFIQKKILNSHKSLAFVIGGAFGFCEELYSRANYKLSISKMTFSHQLIRVIFKEQLYRSFTILKGEKYHNE